MRLRNQRSLSGPASITDNMDADVTQTSCLEVPLSAGIVGTLHPRSGNHAGTLVVPTGHGIVEGDSIVVFWESNYTGGPFAAGAVTATTIAISGAPGTNLPVDNSPIIVSKRVRVTWPARVIPDQVAISAMQFDPAQNTASPFVGRMHGNITGTTDDSDNTGVAPFFLLSDQLVVISDEITAGDSYWSASVFDSFVQYPDSIPFTFDLWNGTRYDAMFKFVSASE